MSADVLAQVELSNRIDRLERRVGELERRIFLSASGKGAGESPSASIPDSKPTGGFPDPAPKLADPPIPVAVGRGEECEAGQFDKRVEGLKPKDLAGIPWMLAFELRRRGWWLRAAVVPGGDSPAPKLADTTVADAWKAMGGAKGPIPAAVGRGEECEACDQYIEGTRGHGRNYQGLTDAHHALLAAKDAELRAAREMLTKVVNAYKKAPAKILCDIVEAEAFLARSEEQVRAALGGEG
jgi:hypothetical protein